MAAQIRVYTFGKLRVERDGAVLDGFISTKAMLLFVYLAMHPGDHARKKLAAMLWSETSDEQAQKNLRTVLSSVRRQVDDAVLIERDELAINPNVPIEVDAERFESGFKQVTSLPIALDSLKTMLALAALYQGDFLANIVVRDAIALDEWIVQKQRQLHELYLRLLYDIVDMAEKQSNYETGLDYAWKLVSFDPLWDAAQRQLMRLLAYANRANDALVQYERFAQLLDDELQATPEEETTALYQQIRSQSLPLPKASARYSIVLPDTPFVEPAEDIEIAQRMLNTPHCHLLTVFGISGIGKTVLVTQLAFHRQHLYRDGACLVSLSQAQSPIELLHLVARALDIPFNNSLDQQTLENIIIDHLKPREMLLVLDNYEQLLPETGFVQRVLEEAVSVQVIVTSLAQLNLYREWLLPLRGLRVPEMDAEDPQEYEAIRLFELTAQRVNPRFNLAESLQDVIRSCQLVDSLPLGIVIAAGWVQHMPPAEISRMMQKDLLQVESVYSDIPSRHQSFQGLLNAMLAHISEQERQALTCLSIFDGSFDFKAALAVAAISPNDFKDLTNKCLVQHTGAFRYHVHSIVRQAFRSQLERSASLQDVSMRYIAYFQQWCDDLYAQGLLLHELTHVIDVEQHNLWEVVGASETERLRFILHIAPAMYEYWVNRGYHARGVVQLLQAGGNHPDIALETRIRGLITLARILERTSQYDLAWTTCEQVLQLEAALNMPEIKARALRVLSEICVRQSHYDRASEYLHTIIGMESQTSIPTNPQIQRLIALAYEDLGEMLISQGEYEAARYYIEIAIRRWVERGESLREAIAQSYLGIIALKRKEYDSAYQLFDAILAQAQKAKNHTLITIFSTHLGTAAMNRGNYAQAHSLFRDALQIAIQIDRKVSMIQIIERLSLLALFHHRDEIAAQLFGFAASMRERLRIPVTPHNQQDHLQHQGDLMERLGQAFDRNYETGRALSLTTVIQLAPSVFDSANVV